MKNFIHRRWPFVKFALLRGPVRSASGTRSDMKVKNLQWRCEPSPPSLQHQLAGISSFNSKDRGRMSSETSVRGVEPTPLQSEQFTPRKHCHVAVTTFWDLRRFMYYVYSYFEAQLGHSPSTRNYTKYSQQTFIFYVVSVHRNVRKEHYVCFL